MLVRYSRRMIRLAWLAGFLALASQSGAAEPGSHNGGDTLAATQNYIDSGLYDMALNELATTQVDSAQNPAEQANRQALYAYTLYLKHRGRGQTPERVQQLLKPALDHLLLAQPVAVRTGDYRLEAWIQLVRGLILVESGQIEAARREFSQGLKQSGKRDEATSFSIRLQMARLASPRSALSELQTLTDELSVSHLPEGVTLTLWLTLMDHLEQLSELELPEALLASIESLSQTAAGKANMLAGGSRNPLRTQSRIRGFEARLHEKNDPEQAVFLLNAAIQKSIQAAAYDLTLLWETRLGKLLAQAGDRKRSIEAYRRAAFAANSIRNNIPISYNGKSSYEYLLEPLYRGLVDGVLNAASTSTDSADKQKYYVEALQGMELLKQSELENYFNERCAFDSAKASINAKTRQLAQRFGSSLTGQDSKNSQLVANNLARATGTTAIIYPILLEDRVEILLINNGEIVRKSVDKPLSDIRKVSGKVYRGFSGILEKTKFEAESKLLYQWLLNPLADELKNRHITHIVYIPDDQLRLIPLSALLTGSNQYVAQQYAVITNSSLQSVANFSGTRQIGNVLLAGLSKPGDTLLEDPLIGKILPASVTEVRGSGVDTTPVAVVRRGDPTYRAAALKQLELPGVEAEINQLRTTLGGPSPLLNTTFTKANLANRMQSGDYQIAHLATHGFFGGNADESFILTHDKAIRLSEMETIIKPDKTTRQSLDMVTFSACQTAQGDNRVPLGFSGIALKAQARNAMGALWSVPDVAAKRFMEVYYLALSRNGGDRALALQQAQTNLLSDATGKNQLSHPGSWASFILVGSWN